MSLLTLYVRRGE